MREQSEVQGICEQFCLDGQIISCIPFGNGHINDTYCVTCSEGGAAVRYVLQRINTAVFRKPDEVMENVLRVTEWLRERITREGGDPEREVLTVIPVKGSGPFFRNGGDCWRMYRYIEDATAYETAEDEHIFRESAVGFGHFQYLLSDFPAHLLHETIPDFHNTVKRFRDFEQAVGENRNGRLNLAQRETEFLLARRDTAGVLLDLLKSGDLPLRVTHNDTKLNNVMIDNRTGKAVCVIDLDTVMPGLSATDFGDSIRFGASTAREDEPDIAKVQFDLRRFACYTEGFLEGCASALTKTEREMLPWGARVITFEQAIRFLGDYLNGDTYYKTEYPEHNLVRARTQIRLLQQMEEQMDEMNAAVASLR